MGELCAIELDTPPDDFLPNEPEGAAFHKAFLAAGISAFTCRYLAIFRGDTRVAIVPYFLHTFSLSTMLPDGLLKKCLAAIRLRIACAGHPSTDFGMTDGELSAEVLALVNATLAKHAALIAYKGFADNLPLPGFIRVRGLPVAVLTLAGDYFAMLDAHRRNDFRHKLRAAESLRVEECSALSEPLLTQVYQLYLNTMTHADMHFETLTPGYFRAVAGLGKFHLYFEEERLIGFLHMLTRDNKANLKYMGMDYQRNRHYFLYFVMCLRAIEDGMRAGCNRLELGASSYQAKRLMGCQLIETSVYYRHNNPLVNWLLGKLKFLLEPAAKELS